jgi:hypothetical protein
MKPCNIKILVACIFLAGCSGDDTEQPPVTPYIKGYVVEYGEDVTPLRDSSGVTILADGPGLDSVVTGSGGRWVLKNLPKGIYTLVFTKTGFGTNKIFGIKYSGSSEINLGRIILVRKPLYTVTSFSVVQSDTGLHVAGAFAVDSGYDYGASVVFFMDTTDLVSSDPVHYIASLTSFTPYPSTAYTLYISNSGLQSLLPLVSGTPVYIAVYPASALGAFSGYPDTATGNWVYTAIGDSSRMSSFTMP